PRSRSSTCSMPTQWPTTISIRVPWLTSAKWSWPRTTRFVSGPSAASTPSLLTVACLPPGTRCAGSSPSSTWPTAAHSTV
ncbi:uncharacterized protein METZ01_LOCUS140581, partial [marine metagenome]